MKKKISLLLVLILSISLLVGCRKNNESKNSDDKIEKITIVTAGEALPYSLLEQDNTWKGIDAEMWAEIEKRTGWKIELKRASFDSIWGEIDSKRADLTANCWATKKERMDKYLASIPYYGDAQAIVVQNNNTTITKPSDLKKGMKVGVNNGQASQTIVEEMAKKQGFEVVLYDGTATALADLNLGRLYAVSCAVTTAQEYENSMKVQFKILDEKLLANNVAYFIAKTERGSKIKTELDKVIEEMIKDGTVGKITKKWLFDDMTKLIK